MYIKMLMAVMAVCLSVVMADVNPSDNVLRYSSITSPKDVLVGDWNNDGTQDYGYVDGGVIDFDYSADGSINKSISSQGASFLDAFSRDMNGDSIKDVVMVDDNGESYLLLGQTGDWGTLNPLLSSSVTLALSAAQITAGNVDGSGNHDLVVISSTNVALFQNFADKGASLTIADADQSLAKVSVSQICLVDLNGDGKEDPIFNEDDQISALSGNNWAAGNLWSVALPAGPNGLAANSGSGTTARVAIGVSSQDTVFIKYGSLSISGNQDSSALGIITGPSGHSFGATVEWADVNGDGVDDLSIMSASISNAGNVAWFDGTSLPAEGQSVSVDSLTQLGETFTGDASDTLGLYHTIVTDPSTSEKLLFANLNDAFVVLPSGLYDMQDQTITFNALSDMTFGDTLTLSATATSGLDVTFTSDNTELTINGTDLSINAVGSGNVSITASQSGNASFNAAASVTRSFQINKAAQTISFAAISDKYVDDGSFDITISSSSGETVSVSSDNTSVASLVTPDATQVYLSGTAGSVSLTASVGSSANYLAAADNVQSFNVLKRDMTISGSPTGVQTITVGSNITLSRFAQDGDTSLSISNSSSNTAVATISAGSLADEYLVQGLSVGTAVITSTRVGNSVYNDAPELTLTVTVTDKLIPEVSFSTPSAVTYGDTLPDNFGATGNISGTVSYNYSSANVLNVGSYQVIATFTPDDTDTYSTNTATATLVVNPAPLTVTAEIQAKDYGLVNPPLTYVVSGFVNSETESDLDSPVTISTNATTASDAGTYSITPAGAADANYTVSFVSADLTISKANSTIASETLPALEVGGTLDLSAYFGNTDGLTLSFSSENDSIASISNGTLSAIAEGTINVTASAAGNANYNAPTDATQSLTISKKANSITNNSATTVAFGSTFAISASATSGETVSFSSSDQSVLTDAGVTASSGNATVTLSSAATDVFAAATDVSFLVTVTNDAPVVSMDTTASSANVGSSITVQGSVSDSDTTGLTWILLADGTSVATGTGAVVSTTYSSGFAGDVSLVLRGNDGDKTTDSSAVTVTFNAIESIVSDNALTGVDSSVQGLTTGSSSSAVETSLTSLEGSTTGVAYTESIKALATTAVAGVKKVFTTGNTEYIVESFTSAGNATSGNLTLQNVSAGNTVVMATGIPDETFTLPTGSVAGSTFVIDMFDDSGEEVTTGFALTTVIEGVVTDATADYKLYVADANGNFTDSGFTTAVVNGTDLAVTMTHFSTFTVVEEEAATAGLSGGSGGGGCLLK